MRALRKLILGETWSLPIGIAIAVGAAAVLRIVAGPDGWWADAGGFVLLALLIAAFAGSVVLRR